MAAKKRARRKGRGPSGGGLWAPKIGLVSLRLFAGGIFLGVFWWKVIRPETPLGETLENFAELDYIPIVQGGIANPPHLFGWRMQWFADLLETVMLPGNAPYVFGTAILFFEGLLGMSLVLGACVRLMGVLGALLMTGFALAKAIPFFTVTQGSNWYLVTILLALALTAAGRIGGLDARLQHRLPRWIA